jgi:hypothetical protein
MGRKYARDHECEQVCVMQAHVLLAGDVAVVWRLRVERFQGRRVCVAGENLKKGKHI